MTRMSFDTDRQGRRSRVSSSEAEDIASHDRSGATLKDEAGGARLRREDPCGRRSLTGLEFRRQRSA